MSSVKVSALVPTFNSSSSIEKLLKSLAWCDEIVVVDSFSIDSTLGLCEAYGAKIYQNEYVSSSKQKNWALSHCSYEWVLQLDSDEVLEPGLADEIRQVLDIVNKGVYAFQMPRKNYILGVWMKHAGIYPDYQIRLFRRDKVQFDDREVHERINVASERLVTLSRHILHHGMPDISKQMSNFNRYTRLEANELRKQKKIFRWHRLLIMPWLIFLYRYLWLQGFRAGWRGVVLCVYLSMFSFFSWAKLWEMEMLGLDKSPA